MGYTQGTQTRNDIEPVLDRKAVYFGIELDNDEIPAPYENGGWEEILGEKLIKLTATLKSARELTVWTGMLQSVNFHHAGYSCFVIVAGDRNLQLTEMVKRALTSAIGGKYVRSSEGIPGEDIGNWRPAFHVSQGQVWEPIDKVDWANCELESTANQGQEVTMVATEASSDLDWLSELEKKDDAAEEAQSEVPEVPSTMRTDRKRRARSDAKIGPLLARLEDELGFPEGALALIHPDDRTPYKANATVRRVRKDWRYDE